MNNIPYTLNELLDATITQVEPEYNGGITSDWVRMSGGGEMRNVVVRDWQVPMIECETSCGTKLPSKPKSIIEQDKDWKDATVSKWINGRKIMTLPIRHGKDIGHELLAMYGDRTTEGRGVSREDLSNEYDRMAEENYDLNERIRKERFNE